MPVHDEPEPDFARLRARSATRRRLALALLTMLLLGGAAGALVVGKRAERAEAEAAAAELRGCLFGAPLDAGESAAQRFRRRQLQLLALSDAERTSRGKKLWPLSCRDVGEQLLGKIKGDATVAEQAALTDLNRKLSDLTAVTKDASEAIQAATALLDARFPGAVPRSSEPLAKAVPSIDGLSPAALLSKKGTSLNRTYTEDNPGISLPVLVDEEGLPAPLYCVFRPDSRDASCRLLTELSLVRGHGVRLLGTSDADSPKLVFAGRRGSEGVFVTGSAKPVDRLYSYGGYAAKDGSVSVLGWDEAARNLVLVQAATGQPAVRTPLKPNFRVGNFFYGSQLLWDQVLVRGITPDNERRLFVLPLDAGNKKTFGLVDIGELTEAGRIRHGEEEQPHLTGCRTKDATVVRVRGDGSDALTFRIHTGFTDPVRAPTFGVLGCYGTSATVVRVGFGRGGTTRIFHDVCTSAGCTHSDLKGGALDKGSSDLRPLDDKDIAAVDLGGKLLVAWIAGERGGLRLRLAPPDTFERAEDVVLLDDHVLAGKNVAVSTVLGFRLYSRESFAVLLVSSLAGLHAFRVDPSGEVEPYNVKQDG